MWLLPHSLRVAFKTVVNPTEIKNNYISLLDKIREKSILRSLDTGVNKAFLFNVLNYNVLYHRNAMNKRKHFLN